MERVDLPAVDCAAMVALIEYGWPGNIRELQNGLARALVLCDYETTITKGLGLQAAGSGGATVPCDKSVNVLLSLGRSFEEAIEETKRLLTVRAWSDGAEALSRRRHALA